MTDVCTTGQVHSGLDVLGLSQPCLRTIQKLYGEHSDSGVYMYSINFQKKKKKKKVLFLYDTMWLFFC